jgi:glycosyltransferase involved in cell wall biosynthesis
LSKRVTIITPTTGSHYLEKNAESVSKQTYDNVDHLIVVDGPPYFKSANDILEAWQDKTVMYLPENTGHSQYNGHRIYGSIPFLVDSDYVMFLDEDNFIDPEHVETLVKVCETNEWAFSLRKIVDKDNNYICLDDCENLGKWPTCLSEQEFFVDVGAYFLPTPIAIQIAPLWYRRARHPDDQPEVDRIIMKTLLEFGWSYDTNGKYTLNYRVGNRDDSVKADFFLWGNAMMEKRYPQKFPWRK